MTRDQIVERYRRLPVPLLLLGPSGVGKTHLARQIDPGLFRVNCAELSDELLAAELFGTVPGAFTGATARPGLVEAARTLFLDEVGELGDAAQAKLLAVLDDGRYRRVGSTEVRHTAVRWIFATWRDPHRWMRRDLHDRLGFDVVRVPPFTDDDLRAAVDGWVDAWGARFGARLRLRPEVVDQLVASGDGAARRVYKRLEHACGTAVLRGSSRVELCDLPTEPPRAHPIDGAVREVFDAADGDAERAAALLGVSRATAFRWRKQLGYRR